MHAIIESIGQMETFRDEWNELLLESPSAGFFLTHEWQLAWWRHLGGRRRLRILAVREAGGRLIGLAPLAISPPSARLLLPIRRNEMLGSGVAGSDHLDLILRRGWEQEALEALVQEAERRRMTYLLDNVRDGDSGVGSFAAALAEFGWRVESVEAGVCPRIDIAGLTWDEYLAGRGSEHRYAFRRKLSGLAGRFDVRFDAARSEAERRDAMEILMDLHQRRWGSRGGGSEAFTTPAFRDFHEEISRLALERGRLGLWILRLDGRPAAAIYGFFHAGVFSFYQSGIDPEFGRWSVGLVAMGLSIRAAIDAGASVYDLLHGTERYKFHWATGTRSLRRWEIYPPRTLGRAYRAIVSTSRTVRRGARLALEAVSALTRAKRSPAPATERLNAPSAD